MSKYLQIINKYSFKKLRKKGLRAFQWHRILHGPLPSSIRVQLYEQETRRSCASGPVEGGTFCVGRLALHYRRRLMRCPALQRWATGEERSAALRQAADLRWGEEGSARAHPESHRRYPASGSPNRSSVLTERKRGERRFGWPVSRAPGRPGARWRCRALRRSRWAGVASQIKAAD